MSLFSEADVRRFQILSFLAKQKEPVRQYVIFNALRLSHQSGAGSLSDLVKKHWVLRNKVSYSWTYHISAEGRMHLRDYEYVVNKKLFVPSPNRRKCLRYEMPLHELAIADEKKFMEARKNAREFNPYQSPQEVKQ